MSKTYFDIHLVLKGAAKETVTVESLEEVKSYISKNKDKLNSDYNIMVVIREYVEVVETQEIVKTLMSVTKKGTTHYTITY